MSPLSSTKFLVRPAPLDDEYILSYLERLRIENGYSSIDLICKTIFGTKISLVDIVKGNFDKILFSTYTSLNFDEIKNLCITDNKYYVSANVYLCLECFKEVNYIKKDWYIRDYVCCHHKLPISCRCSFCNSLYSFNILNNYFCKKCHKNIFSGNLFRLNTNKNISDIFKIFHNVFKFKYYSPNSLSYSTRYFSSCFNKSYDLLINKNNCFEFLLRKYLFMDRVYSRQVSNFVTDYIFFLIEFEDIICTFDNIVFYNNLNEILRKYTIHELKIEITTTLVTKLDSYYFISHQGFLKKVDSGKYCFLSYANCANILVLQEWFINLLCRENILKCYDGVYVDIKSVFDLCVDIKVFSTEKYLISDFIYFENLSVFDKIKVIKNLKFGMIILYNFNGFEVFNSIKIKINDLNYFS